MFKEATYQIVAARKLNQETMLWQVPSLSLTGQAFLFSISLGSTSSRLSRLIASGLSVLIYILSLHLMIRHHAVAVADSKWLEKYQKAQSHLSKTKNTNKQLGLSYVVHAKPPHEHNHYVESLMERSECVRGLESSFKVWVIGLSLVGLTAAFVFVLAIVYPIAFNVSSNHQVVKKASVHHVKSSRSQPVHSERLYKI